MKYILPGIFLTLIFISWISIDLIHATERKTAKQDTVKKVDKVKQIRDQQITKNTAILKTYISMVNELGTDDPKVEECADLIRGDQMDYLLYQINLSEVVKKYIGDTEKNLKELFQNAEVSDIILTFDEADALFGKRSHDSYTLHVLTRLSDNSGNDNLLTSALDRLKHDNSLLVMLIENDIDQAKLDIPTINKNSWMIHGRILDPSYKGISRLNIEFLDKDQSLDDKPGSTATDEKGYFSFSYGRDGKPDERVAKLSAKIVKLIVTDEKGEVVYEHDKPFTITAGIVDYIEIIIDPED